MEPPWARFFYYSLNSTIMIRLINDDNQQESALTMLELSKVMDCVLNQMLKYNDMLGTTLNDDKDITSSIERGRHDLREILSSLIKVANND